MKKINIVALAVLGSAMIAEALWGQGRNDIVVQTGQTVPNGNGTYADFGNILRLNDFGQVAFRASLSGTSGGSTDASGIFRGSGGTITQIARQGQAANDSNGTYGSFSELLLNNSGQVAFRANLVGTSGGTNDNLGIFRGSGGTITQIARKGQAPPGGNGNYTSLTDLTLNNSGQVAFSGTLTGTSGGTSDNLGIFRGSGGSVTQIVRDGQSALGGTFNDFFEVAPMINDSGQVAFNASLSNLWGVFRGNGASLTQIARENQAAPDGNGTFDYTFRNYSINNSGQVGFSALLKGTNGGSSDNQGIFRGSGGSITQIVREGQTAPDGNGIFSMFESENSGLNEVGQVAFKSFLSGTSGGGTGGLFVGSGGVITQIARTSQLSPDANGTFSGFLTPSLNDSGQVAFRASLNGTSGGSSDNHGIFTSDGIDFVKVVRKGDSLGGGIVAEFSAVNLSLNESGQIAYEASLTNGQYIIGRWTPELRWRSQLSSNWDTPGRWTLGLKPASVHDVFIDPAANVTVNGPNTTTTVRSLQIGGGTGLATLNLNNSVNLTATNGVNIASNGTLKARGTISGNVNNVGTIEVASATNVIINGSLIQNGTMRIFSTGEATVQGAFSGNGGFVGGGTVIARNQLRPGNSAASVLYDGNLMMTGSTDTFIELGGLGLGQFDQLRVTGDLSLDGDLKLSLINGFHLSLNQKFLIGDVLGNRLGQFSGLSEGARVQNFGEFDLLISYLGGNGNDITLYTSPAKNGTPYLTGDGFSAVPEPSGLMLLGIAAICGFARRQRNSFSRC